MYDILATHEPHSQDLRWAVRVLANLADQGFCDVTTRWKYVLEEFENYIGASHSFVSISKRTAARDTALKGFRIAFLEDRVPPPQSERDIYANWFSNPANCIGDPSTERAFTLHRKGPTVFTQRYLVNTFDANIRDHLPSVRLLRKLHISDRLMGVIPLGGDLVVSYCLDRMKGERDFNEREEILFEIILAGIVRLSRDLVFSLGLYEGQERLTPREQCVMQLLLGPMTEKEMAEELDLSHYYIHDVVKSIYRKMKVGSRAELMALFSGTTSTPPF